jgi:hypothetical protein
LRSPPPDCRRARLIRRRYTILDCLKDSGWLDTAIGAAINDGSFAGALMTPPPTQTSPS